MITLLTLKRRNISENSKIILNIPSFIKKVKRIQISFFNPCLLFNYQYFRTSYYGTINVHFGFKKNLKKSIGDKWFDLVPIHSSSNGNSMIFEIIMCESSMDTKKKEEDGNFDIFILSSIHILHI